MTEMCILNILMTEMYILNILMAENLDDRNFINNICIADMVLTMQSGKKMMFTVTTHRILKHKPQGPTFKCGQCGEMFNKNDLMKAHEKSHGLPGGQVEYKCTKGGYNKTFTTNGALRQNVRNHERVTKHVIFVEKCFFLIIHYQSI